MLNTGIILVVQSLGDLRFPNDTSVLLLYIITTDRISHVQSDLNKERHTT